MTRINWPSILAGKTGALSPIGLDVGSSRVKAAQLRRTGLAVIPDCLERSVTGTGQLARDRRPIQCHIYARRRPPRGRGCLSLHATGWQSWTTGGYALRTAAFTTLGWSALNLLPIVPLDGGHLLELALPGTPAVRRRLAAQVSIALAVGAGVVAYKAGMPYGLLLAVLFAAQNLAVLKQPQPA